MFLKYGLLVVAVAMLIAIGSWILNTLARNPFDMPRLKDAPAAKEAEVIEVPSLGTVEKKPVALAISNDSIRMTKEVEEKLADFTLIKRELEQKGAAEWGADQYATIIKIGQDADAAFMRKEYETASETYSVATARAREMAEHMENMFRNLIAAGSDAINSGDGKSARQKFKWALMIDPASQSAQRGWERAEKIETVMQRLAAGQRHEMNGNLSLAHADYQEALRLDPDSKDAQKSFNRVRNEITDQKFQQLVSEGLSAYHKKDYPRAKERLLKAKTFKPGSKEVISALAQVDQGARLARIESLQQKAAKAEKKENWKKALQAYQAVLAIDKNVQFAVQGQKRSLQQIEINQQITFFLENPGKLGSDRQLENALMLIRQVDAMAPKGPRRTKALEALKKLVSAAQTPVKLIIESDNQTEIVLYRVGKLGRFDAREIQLRPGTYTVVGARDGYKDVRRQIVIKPGQAPLSVSVICKVEI